MVRDAASRRGERTDLGGRVSQQETEGNPKPFNRFASVFPRSVAMLDGSFPHENLPALRIDGHRCRRYPGYRPQFFRNRSRRWEELLMGDLPAIRKNEDVANDDLVVFVDEGGQPSRLWICAPPLQLVVDEVVADSCRDREIITDLEDFLGIDPESR